MNASRVGAYAGQAAFFMFLSLIPLVMLFLSLLKQFGTESLYISVSAEEFVPGVISSFFNIYIDEIMDDTKLSLTIVSACVLLWSASKGIFAIIGGLNSVYEIKEDRGFLSSIYFNFLHSGFRRISRRCLDHHGFW